jgi:hypothetical protein
MGLYCIVGNLRERTLLWRKHNIGGCGMPKICAETIAGGSQVCERFLPRILPTIRQLLLDCLGRSQ